jgi:SM-20-related protein
MSLMNLDALRRTPLVTEPFEHIVVPGFLTPESGDVVDPDFPKDMKGGSFPVETLTYGPGFEALLEEVRDKPFWDAMSQKFGLDLDALPQMITVRGRCQRKDGRIHPDTATKVITCLIYLNRGWSSPEGRLRILRGDSDLDDFVAEVPPDWGTLLAFRRADNSYHGHTPFEGERRSIQINWVVSRDVVDRELARHRMSARLKRLVPFA